MMQQPSKKYQIKKTNEKYLETRPYSNGINTVERYKTIVLTHKTHIYIDSYLRKKKQIQ